ncbi:helix-turn-helix domain-containing protein [Chitinophagaceae bacterium LWZ2-11]
MNIGLQILFFISALGAFNGIVLSLYLFFVKKRRSIAAILLYVLLLMLSIRVAKSVFLYFNPQLPKIYRQIGLSACFLIGPSLYYFFRSVLMKVSQVPKTWKWNWGIQLSVLVLTGILLPYETHPKIWNNIIAYVIYLQWMVYVVATGILLRKELKTFVVNISGLNDTEKFWVILFVSNSVIYLVYLLSLISVIPVMYITGPVLFSFLLYFIVFFNLYGAKFEKPELSDKPEKRKIADPDAAIWIEKLERAVQDKKLYKDPNLKLSDVANSINISVHQLSQLLNDNLGRSFSTYINEYRIEEACKLIAADSRLTFEAIGYEVGYNSKSTFYSAFKKIKDTTPALYKESIESQQVNGTIL